MFNQAVSATRGGIDTNTAMAKVFAMMGLGLLVTALLAMFTAGSPAMMAAIFGTPLKWVVLLAPLGFVIAMSFGYNKFSAGTLKILFYVYAALNGLALASIMLMYSMGTLFAAFFSSAAIFGIMAAYGYFTKKDLTSWGKLLFFALIGIIIAMIINIFVGSTVMATAISCLAVLVFIGLTAYDTQQIKETLATGVDQDKAVTMGALTLYLDFLNMFLHILRLMGVAGGDD